MRIRLAVPDELDDQDRKAALDAALESVTRTNTGMIRTGKVPPAAKMIKAGKVVWKPEPPGDEHFDLPGTIIGRGWGDCDDLAPWRERPGVVPVEIGPDGRVRPTVAHSLHR